MLPEYLPKGQKIEYKTEEDLKSNPGELHLRRGA